MKTKKLLALLPVIILAFTVNAQNQTTTHPNSHAEFEAMLVQWKEAYNSGDAQNLLPLYAEDAIYTSSHVTGLEAIGRDRLISNFQTGISGGGHIDDIEILKIETSCEMAGLFCKYQATNAGVTVTGRNLLVLKKQEERWVISVHMTVVN